MASDNEKSPLQLVARPCWWSVLGSPLLKKKYFFELLMLDGTTTEGITKTLRGCLHKHGFDDQFLCLVAFACDGASVMLGRRAGVDTLLSSSFLDLFGGNAQTVTWDWQLEMS
ncbi:hypothetical protein ILYODFUR_023031 [Ilyodon furcidens]|uniref:Uncharacterized protein n=1 Tax=Ilyodon furcidens TaxID=33524 RepID=A0ABV0T111_9TELE